MNKFFARIDKRYAKVGLYAGATVLLTFGACMILYYSSGMFVKLWELICSVMEPLIYGAALSYVLNPLVKRVSHHLRRYKAFAGDERSAKRRSAAVIISLLLVLLFLLSIVLVLVLMVTHSIASLRLEQIQSLLGTAQGDFADLLRAAQDRLTEWGILAAESESNLLSTVSDVKDLLTNIVFAVIFGVYFLIDGPRVARYLGTVLHALLGDSLTMDYKRLIADADKVFSGYFRGQGIDALVVGALSGVALTAVGVPFGPVVGLLAGLGNLIPYVGGPVGFGSVALMCIPNAAWDKMIWGFVVMGLVMFVDGNVINPKLLSDNVEVHPILVVAALIAGGAVGGIAGMLVAVPMAAFLKIQVDRWVEKREHAKGTPAAKGDGPTPQDQ